MSFISKTIRLALYDRYWENPENFRKNFLEFLSFERLESERKILKIQNEISKDISNPESTETLLKKLTKNERISIIYGLSGITI